MRVVVKFLVERADRFYFRRRVPEELRQHIGKLEWKVALGPTSIDQLEIIKRVRSLTRETDAAIRQAQRGADGLAEIELADQAYDWAARNELLGNGREAEPDGALSEYDRWLDRLLIETMSRAGKQTEDELDVDDFHPLDWAKIQTTKRRGRLPISVTVRVAAQSYAKRYKSGELAKAEDVAVDQFVSFAGDRTLETIRRADVADWINHLLTERQNKPSTVRRRVNSLRAIVNRAIEDYDLDIKNPFNRPRLEARAAGSQEDRLPFHASHLDAISQYIGASGAGPETRLLLTLLKATGCRPMEIAGLDWADVHLDHDVPHVMIRPNAHRGLKTLNAERDVPLVGDAHSKLAAYSKPGATGPMFSGRARDTGALSQRLNKAIRAAGVPRSARLVVYSFRHGFEQALRDSGAAPDLQRYLLGHGEQSITDRYGASKPSLTLLRSAIESAMPHLGNIDKRNYRPEELLQSLSHLPNAAADDDQSLPEI